MSKTLWAMGKNSHAKLFLAGYYWDDNKSCISFTHSKGYGILKPNGKDLSVDTMALGTYNMHMSICHSELTVQ